MERPSQLARPNVVTADVLRRRLLLRAQIAAAPAVSCDDHDVTDDQRSVGLAESRGRVQVLAAQVRHAMLAEV